MRPEGSFYGISNNKDKVHYKKSVNQKTVNLVIAHINIYVLSQVFLE